MPGFSLGLGLGAQQSPSILATTPPAAPALQIEASTDRLLIEDGSLLLLE